MKTRSSCVLGLLCLGFATTVTVGCGAADGETDSAEKANRPPIDKDPSVPAPEAATAMAHHTGPHTICARTLTVYNAGPRGVLLLGSSFNIEHFGDGINHAWGNARDTTGFTYTNVWVYNGWFCP